MKKRGSFNQEAAVQTKVGHPDVATDRVSVLFRTRDRWGLRVCYTLSRGENEAQIFFFDLFSMMNAHFVVYHFDATQFRAGLL